MFVTMKWTLRQVYYSPGMYKAGLFVLQLGGETVKLQAEQHLGRKGASHIGSSHPFVQMTLWQCCCSIAALESSSTDVMASLWHSPLMWATWVTGLRHH